MSETSPVYVLHPQTGIGMWVSPEAADSFIPAPRSPQPAQTDWLEAAAQWMVTELFTLAAALTPVPASVFLNLMHREPQTLDDQRWLCLHWNATIQPLIDAIGTPPDPLLTPLLQVIEVTHLPYHLDAEGFLFHFIDSDRWSMIPFDDTHTAYDYFKAIAAYRVPHQFAWSSEPCIPIATAVSPALSLDEYRKAYELLSATKANSRATDSKPGRKSATSTKPAPSDQ